MWNRSRRKTLPKYQNEKVESLCFYGFSHRSKLERSVCDMNRIHELAGLVEHLAHEDTLYLSAARYRYVADFKLKNAHTGEIFWREAKGQADGRWPTTKKMWKFYGFGRLEIWMGEWRNPRLAKTIITAKEPI